MKKLITCLIFLSALTVWILPACAAPALYWDRAGLDGNTRVYVSPTYNSDGCIYAWTAERLYVSKDEGVSWNQINTMPILAVQVAFDNKIYFLVEESGNQPAIYYYDGVKEDWVKKCNAPVDTRTFAVVSSPSNSNVLLAGRPYSDSSYWEMFRSEDGGGIWNPVNYNKGCRYFVPMPDGNYVFTREIGGPLTSLSKNGGDKWEEFGRSSEYDYFFISPNARQDGQIFAIAGGTNIELSTDQANYWYPVTRGLDKRDFLVDIAFSPSYSSDKTVYAADLRGRVYVNNTSEITWVDMEMELPSGVNLNNIAVLPNNNLLGGTSNGIYTTGNTAEKEAAQQAAPPVAELTRTMNVQFRLGTPTYTINGQEWDMDTSPYLANDRTYVPVRYLAYGLGINDENIQWNSRTREVTLTKGGTVVKLKVDDLTMNINDRTVTMDVSPQIDINSRTMLPARWVAEAFDAEVTWDARQRVVGIRYYEPITAD